MTLQDLMLALQGGQGGQGGGGGNAIPVSGIPAPTPLSGTPMGDQGAGGPGGGQSLSGTGGVGGGMGSNPNPMMGGGGLDLSQGDMSQLLNQIAAMQPGATGSLTAGIGGLGGGSIGQFGGGNTVGQGYGGQYGAGGVLGQQDPTASATPASGGYGAGGGTGGGGSPLDIKSILGGLGGAASLGGALIGPSQTASPTSPSLPSGMATGESGPQGGFIGGPGSSPAYSIGGQTFGGPSDVSGLETMTGAQGGTTSPPASSPYGLGSGLKDVAGALGTAAGGYGLYQGIQNNDPWGAARGGTSALSSLAGTTIGKEALTSALGASAAGTVGSAIPWVGPALSIAQGMGSGQHGLDVTSALLTAIAMAGTGWGAAVAPVMMAGKYGMDTLAAQERARQIEQSKHQYKALEGLPTMKNLQQDWQTPGDYSGLGSDLQAMRATEDIFRNRDVSIPTSLTNLENQFQMRPDYNQITQAAGLGIQDPNTYGAGLAAATQAAQAQAAQRPPGSTGYRPGMGFGVNAQGGQVGYGAGQPGGPGQGMWGAVPPNMTALHGMWGG